MRIRKYTIFLICLFFLSEILTAQTNNEIVIGKIDSLKSEILGEYRSFWVSYPKNDTSHFYAPKKYPVLYLLDGNELFTTVTGMTRYLNSDYAGQYAPEMIIVGVVHKERTKELGPSSQSDKAEKFISYIHKELIPYITSNYPVLPYKIFAGHSLGGLAVTNAFFKKDRFFNAYFALDPSMWWANRTLLKQTDSLLRVYEDKSTPFFLAIANTMENGFDTASVKSDKSNSSLHIRSILDLNRNFKTHHQKFSSRFYDHYPHDPIFPTGLFDGLIWLFKDYQLEISPRDLSDSTIDQVKQKIITHEQKLKNLFGFEMSIDERVIDQIASYCISRKYMMLSLELLEMNVARYPLSFHANEVLGDFFSKMNQPEKAKEYYKKALQIKDHPVIRAKLNN